ncbi:hypothetical protein LTR05_001847 [Lithohypha guttulata]|uniref:Uncharacterized protein n=1 Tax=Lithohypha guttulata TaxID=1690604 RepID=A0AAN7YAN8_9EURO|nr:hypothetical protein LTR05_001847 [Lithohypha guttulata]
METAVLLDGFLPEECGYEKGTSFECHAIAYDDPRAVFTDTQACISYLQGVQWRLLSPDTHETPLTKFPPPHNAEVGNPLIQEFAKQEATEENLYKISSHKAPSADSTPQIDWKFTGQYLRDMATSLESGIWPTDLKGERSLIPRLQIDEHGNLRWIGSEYDLDTGKGLKKRLLL